MKLLNGDIDIATNILQSQGISDPTSDEIAMSFVRYRRTGLLSNCDWRANSDLTMPASWIKYRKDLRDLPESSTPKLDSENNLTGVNWPTKPE